MIRFVRLSFILISHSNHHAIFASNVAEVKCRHCSNHHNQHSLRIRLKYINMIINELHSTQRFKMSTQDNGSVNDYVGGGGGRTTDDIE